MSSARTAAATISSGRSGPRPGSRSSRRRGRTPGCPSARPPGAPACTPRRPRPAARAAEGALRRPKNRLSAIVPAKIGRITDIGHPSTGRRLPGSLCSSRSLISTARHRDRPGWPGPGSSSLPLPAGPRIAMRAGSCTEEAPSRMIWPSSEVSITLMPRSWPARFSASGGSRSAAPRRAARADRTAPPPART